MVYAAGLLDELVSVKPKERVPSRRLFSRSFRVSRACGDETQKFQRELLHLLPPFMLWI